ncbi:hypothetical protein ACHAXA_004481 [Cyclostephanos tholiformis]|uniref:Inositol polyphosphate-related phosphatase domain-containing protein n=1 Tax=Cyclostephanos tholiformis TaxID=382380 RepID=A0ABD3RYQ9_9STRA
MDQSESNASIEKSAPSATTIDDTIETMPMNGGGLMAAPEKTRGGIAIAINDHESDQRGEISDSIYDEDDREKEEKKASRDVDDDAVEIIGSAARSSGSGRDFVICSNGDDGVATTETNDENESMIRWDIFQIDAVADSTDSGQPPQQREDLIKSPGERIISEEINAACTNEDSVLDFVSSDANCREDGGSDDEKVDGAKNSTDHVRLPETKYIPRRTAGMDLTHTDELMTESSMKEASNIDDEKSAEKCEESDELNSPLDVDRDGSHVDGKRKNGDSNENIGELSDENSSFPIGECALTDDAIEQTELMQSVSAPVDTFSKLGKGSRTKNDLYVNLTGDDCVTLSIVTWNLGEAQPSEKDVSFLKRFRESDLVMIGAQECEEIKPRRTEGRRSRHLRRTIITMLGKEYVPLAIHSLGGIQCALFCHRNVLGDVEMIDLVDVACGVGGVFHNKGAIGIYLKMKRRSTNENSTKTSQILLVTGHLAAHVKNVDARNGNFKRIVSELEARAPARFLRPIRKADGSPVICDGAHLMSSMDHVFFAGDLNYRIDLPREYVERCIIDVQQCKSLGAHGRVDTLMKSLLRRDQLLQTMASGRAFSNFNEGKITFLPTFKFDKGTSNYDTSHKRRVPAWTDRIVFRSNKVSVLEYDSVAQAKHSDHRPVFGTFKLGWRGEGEGDNISSKRKTILRTKVTRERDLSKSSKS